MTPKRKLAGYLLVLERRLVCFNLVECLEEFPNVFVRSPSSTYGVRIQSFYHPIHLSVPAFIYCLHFNDSYRMSNIGLSIHSADHESIRSDAIAVN